MTAFLITIILNSPLVALLDTGPHLDFMRQILDARGAQYTVYDTGNSYIDAFVAARQDGATVYLFPYVPNVDYPPLLEVIRQASSTGIVIVAAGAWYERVRPEYLPYVTVAGAYYVGPHPCPVVGNYERCPITYLNNRQPEVWLPCHGDYWQCSTSEAVALAGVRHFEFAAR